MFFTFDTKVSTGRKLSQESRPEKTLAIGFF